MRSSAPSACVLRCLRAAVNPYPVAGPSLAIAAAVLEQGEGAPRARARRIAAEREQIASRLLARGWRPEAGQGNFVLARGGAGARECGREGGRAGGGRREREM